MVETTTIVTASVAGVATGILAYAVYFDYKRRSDTEFRKEIRRNARRTARAEKERANAETNQFRKKIKEVVAEIAAAGFPTDPAKKEEMFMTCVSEGEVLSAEQPFEAAVEFYKALKVYPQPGDLINIYDQTVKKQVLDILAEMIAADPTLAIGPSGASSDDNPLAGMPSVGLD